MLTSGHIKCGMNGFLINTIIHIVPGVNILLWCTTQKYTVSKSRHDNELIRGGGTKAISSVLLFSDFSALLKYTLAIEYHVYIWQVSPQLSFSNHILKSHQGISIDDEIRNASWVSNIKARKIPHFTMTWIESENLLRLRFEFMNDIACSHICIRWSYPVYIMHLTPNAR